MRHCHSLRFSSIFLFLFQFSPSNAFALNFDIEPSLLLKSTYTDNEKQSASPTSQDIISEISPGLSITATGIRTRANINYKLRKHLSYTQNINKLNHDFRGDGNFDLIKNYVNLFAIGSFEQRQNRVGRNILLDESILINDTADFATATAGTEVNNYSKRYFDAQMKYTFNIAKNNSPTFADTYSHRMLASLKNGKNLHRFNWGGNASFQELNDNNLNRRKIAEVTGNIGYLIQPRSGVRFTLGYESNPQYSRINPGNKSKGSIIETTVFWRSSKNFGIETSAGQRAYGTHYLIKADWQSQFTSLSTSYKRSVIGDTFSADFQQKIRQAIFRFQFNETLSEYNYVNFLQPPPINEDVLNPPLPLLPSTQTGTFIVRRLSSGLTLQGLKNTLDFSADYETRKYAETGTSGRTYKTKAHWKNTINALASINLSVEAVHANDASLRATGLYTLGKLSYEHTVKKHFLASLVAQRWEHKPNNANTTQVNTVSVSIKASY